MAQGGALWIESPTGTITKDYMGGIVYGSRCDIASGAPFVFSGKRLLHCTEEWTGRRLVAIAFTVMGSISITRELHNLLGALGFVTPDSLEVDFYTRQLMGPGQLRQLTLKTTKHPQVWQAGKLNHGGLTTLVLSDSESHNEACSEPTTKVLKSTYTDSYSPPQCTHKDSQSSLATVPWLHEEVCGG